MLRPLDDHLRNEKRSVTTVAGLLSHSLETSSELRLILANAQEYSAKFVLQRFENVFKSLHKISAASLSVVKILVMARRAELSKGKSCSEIRRLEIRERVGS